MERPTGKALPWGRQIVLLMQGLESIATTTTDPRYSTIMAWVRDLPAHAQPPELLTAVARAFSSTPERIKLELNPKTVSTDFEPLVPRNGWLRDYVEYTRTTEPPTVFHFFVGATVLGAQLKRNVYFDKGYKSLYPGVCTLLVAPSGRCRKTSACELGIALYREAGGLVLADKITPEALVTTYSERAEATGLIYAGELKQFLGSQKYMEGMIPLLTRLFDCPDKWSSATIARAEITLTNVSFSMLGASTMDWLRMLPGDTYGGGFMSRFLLVVQEDTPRSFPLPPPMSDYLRVKLVTRLVELNNIKQKMSLTPAAERWFRDWYNDRSQRGTEEKQFSGYFERKPDHLFRLAMLLSVSEDDGGALQLKQLESALKILNWAEAWLPNAFEQLSSTDIGETHLRMLAQLKKAGGSMKYSDWLRRNSGRMHAGQFKQYVATLRDGKQIDFDAAQNLYYLTPEGWK